MKIKILTVGKIKEKWYAEALAEYVKRLDRFAAVEIFEADEGDVRDMGEASVNAALKKEAEQMRSAVKVGDKITTIGGVVGVVCAVKDDKIVVETSADRVRVEFAKWAISSNDTANEAAKAAAEKAAAARKRAKEEKKASKG